MASIRKRGHKYQVQVRRLGLPTVSRSFHVLKDAQTWARQMELQADRRDFPPNPKALQQITLGELVVRYRDTVTPRKRTAKAERIVLNAFLLHPLCRRRLSEITRVDFASYRDDRLRVIKPSSLKRELVPLHNLYEISREEWGIPIQVNPLSKLRITGADQKRERRLRPGELERLLASACACRNKMIEPLVRFALATAMRRGEILNLRQAHIDRSARTLLIPQSKNGYSRTIPLSRDASDVLDSLKHDHDLVFPLSGNAVRLAWERLTKRAGIGDLHFHDLRHEAISGLFERGLTVPEVALISGHRDMRMLLRYSHAMREAALEKLDAQSHRHAQDC